MMISVKNLSKSYKKKVVLDDVTIDFDGRINFLLGDNGVGKSTMIHILAGVVKPNVGEIFINEKKISYTDGTYKKDVGFLLNLPTYPYHLKLEEYINLLNPIYTIDLVTNKQYEDELLNFFDLNKYLGYKIAELSTGYIMRVKLFAAMLHNPSFFIFDEPFSGLDKNFIPQLIEKIITLSKQGKYFLMTTHLSQITAFNFPDCNHYNILNGKILKIN